MQAADTRKHAHFSAGFAALLLILVIAGFGSNTARNPEILSQVTGLHHVHAIIMLGWFLLLLVQPLLIARENPGLHRMFGRLSIILALGVLAGGLSIIRYHFIVRSGTLVAALDLFVLLNFVAFYLVAIVAIRRSQAAIGAHQRLMLFTGVAMTPPALARLADALGHDPFAAVPVVIALAFALAARDVLARRWPHPVSIIGALMIIGGVIASVAIADAEWFRAALEAVWGTPRAG